MIKLPQTGIWTQPNLGDNLGDIWASFNIDLSENEGRLRVGKRLLLNTGTTDIAEITGYPVGFRYFGGKIFTVAGASGTGYVFSNSGTLSGSFSKVTGANTPTNCDSTISDMEVLDGVLYISTASNSIYYTTDGTTWGSSFTVGASDSANAHLLSSYGGRMYMTKLQSQILSWDTSRTIATSGSYTLQLGNSASNVITFIRSSSNRIWIGTVNTTGGKGYVYEWDGVSTQVTRSYRLEASGALSCVIKDDIPYIMDTNGVLLVWNGGTFKEIAKLNRKNNKVLFNHLSNTNQRFIHPNGMSLVQGKINIFIDGTNYDATSHNGTQEETIPSGVYEYTENKGLVHKHSIGSTKTGGTIVDYGQVKIYGAGALSEIISGSTAPVTTDGRFLLGAGYYTDATTTTYGIFYDNILDTKQKAGYVITSKQTSSNVQNMWQRLYVLYRKLLTASDKIIIKYRVEDKEPVTGTITWTSTTTFTVPNSSVVASDYWTAGTGGEVEILAGIGAGKCAHITNAELNVGTWTVTVDETFTSATGTSLARFQNWKKCGIITQDINTFYQANVDKTSNWVQSKIWMLFTGKDEIEKLLIEEKNK